jgi:hypothetical protein
LVKHYVGETLDWVSLVSVEMKKEEKRRRGRSGKEPSRIFARTRDDV